MGTKYFWKDSKFIRLIKFHFHAKTHDPNISKKDPKGFENNFILQYDSWIRLLDIILTALTTKMRNKGKRSKFRMNSCMQRDERKIGININDLRTVNFE